PLPPEGPPRRRRRARARPHGRRPGRAADARRRSRPRGLERRLVHGLPARLLVDPVPVRARRRRLPGAVPGRIVDARAVFRRPSVPAFVRVDADRGRRQGCRAGRAAHRGRAVDRARLAVRAPRGRKARRGTGRLVTPPHSAPLVWNGLVEQPVETARPERPGARLGASRRGVRAAEGARLEIAYGPKGPSRVQIPPSPLWHGGTAGSPHEGTGGTAGSPREPPSPTPLAPQQPL